jgi:tight adherence protein C
VSLSSFHIFLGFAATLSTAMWGHILVKTLVMRQARSRKRALAFFISRQLPKAESNFPDSLFVAIGTATVLPTERAWIERKAASLGHPGDEYYRDFLLRKGRYLTLAGGVSLLVGLSGGLPWLLVVLVTLTGLFYPNLQLYNEEHYRNLEIARRLPSSVDLLVLAVESGMNLLGALKLIAEKENGPVADELSRVLREVELGQSRVAALTALRERANEPTIRGFAGALIQAETLGIGIGPVLKEQSVLLRKVRREQAREQAQKIPVKILFPIMLCFVPSIFLIVLGPVGLSFLGN